MTQAKRPTTHAAVSIGLLLAGLALLLPIRFGPRVAVNDALALTCYVQEGQRCCWMEGEWPHLWWMCMENSSETPIDPEG